MGKVIILVVILSLLVFAGQANAWNTGFKYIQTIQYNYHNERLEYVTVGFSNNYMSSTAEYYVFIGDIAANVSYDVMAHSDLRNLLSQLERMRLANCKVYIENYTNRYANNTAQLMHGDNFRSNM